MGSFWGRMCICFQTRASPNDPIIERATTLAPVFHLFWKWFFDKGLEINLGPDACLLVEVTFFALPFSVPVIWNWQKVIWSRHSKERTKSWTSHYYLYHRYWSKHQFRLLFFILVFKLQLWEFNSLSRPTFMCFFLKLPEKFLLSGVVYLLSVWSENEDPWGKHEGDGVQEEDFRRSCWLTEWRNS